MPLRDEGTCPAGDGADVRQKKKKVQAYRAVRLCVLLVCCVWMSSNMPRKSIPYACIPCIMHTVHYAYRALCIPCIMHTVHYAYRALCIPCIMHTVHYAYRAYRAYRALRIPCITHTVHYAYRALRIPCITHTVNTVHTVLAYLFVCFFRGIICEYSSGPKSKQSL